MIEIDVADTVPGISDVDGEADVVELVVMRGAAGAGKSTWAKAWVAHRRSRRIRVNRDLLRIMGHGGFGDRATENAITVGAHGMIEALLRAGWSVVVDDTNLRQDVVDELAGIASDAGVLWRVVDLRRLPKEVCLRQNRQRTAAQGRVEDEVIERQYARHIDVATIDNCGAV